MKKPGRGRTTLPPQAAREEQLSTLSFFAPTGYLNVGSPQFNRNMTTLAEQLERIDRMLSDALSAEADQPSVSSADRVATLLALGRLQRRIDGAITTCADDIATTDARLERSTRLTSRVGCRDVAELLRRTLRVDGHTARRYVAAAAGTHREMSMTTGEMLPSMFPGLSDAFAGGELSLTGFLACTEPLRKNARLSADNRAVADALLTRFALGLPLDGDAASADDAATDADDTATDPDDAPRGPAPTTDELAGLAAHLLSRLDPDGAEPRDDAGRRRRFFTIGKLRDGTVPVRGELLPDVATQLERLFDSLVNPKVSSRDGDGGSTETSSGANPDASNGEDVGESNEADAGGNGTRPAGDPEPGADAGQPAGGSMSGGDDSADGGTSPRRSTVMFRPSVPPGGAPSDAASSGDGTSRADIAPPDGDPPGGPPGIAPPDGDSPDIASNGDPSNGAPRHGDATNNADGAPPDVPDDFDRLYGDVTEDELAAAREERSARARTAAPAVEYADLRTHAQKRHDALATALTVAAASGGMPRIGGAAPTLVVTVRADDYASRNGRARLEGTGYDAPLGIADHAACSGLVHRVLQDESGAIAGMSTTGRIFNAAQRRAITARDRHCLIPGCGIAAEWCEIHHVVPWARGGATSIDNGVPLCWHHHRTIDTGAWAIRMVDGMPQVRGPGWWDPYGLWRSPHLGYVATELHIDDAVEQERERARAYG